VTLASHEEIDYEVGENRAQFREHESPERVLFRYMFERAVGPVLSDVEMARESRTWEEVRAKLQSSFPMMSATDLPADMMHSTPGTRRR